MATVAAEARADTSTAPPSEAPPGEAPPAAHHTPHRWWVLAVIGLAQLMVVLDATIVNIALPSAQADLAFSDDGRQWVITAYSLAFGSLLLLGGRLADLFGRKTTLLIGLIGFAAASGLAGAANGFELLVIGRALQGVFGALLAPSAMSLLTTTFTDPKERAKAFGVYGAIAGSGGAIGMLLGGVLTEHLDWRWTLYVNLVIAAFAVVGALIFIRRPARAERPKLDLLGTVLVAAGVFGIVYGFANAETHSWGHWMCWVFLAAGGVLLALFTWWQTRARNPLLPLRVFADRNRAASFLAVFISGAGMFGVFLFLTFYLQQVLGYTPVKTGLAFLPMIGALMVMAQLATTVLIPRIGPKPIVPLGMGMAVGGLGWLTALDLSSSYAADVLPPLLLLGVGLGLVMPVAMSLATLGVDPQDQGVASATVNTMQQVGGSIGTALFSTMAAGAATDYLTDHPEAAGSKIGQAQAAVHSYAAAYWWAAAFFAAGLLVSVLLYRRGRPQHPQSAPEQGAAQEPAQEPVSDAAPQSVPEPRPEQVAAPAAASVPDGQHAPAGPGIQGRVTAADSTPVPAAVVTLIDPTGSQIGRTHTDDAGTYWLPAPGSGDYILVGSATGHQPHIATLTATGQPLTFDLLLSAAGGLFGTVTGDDRPVPDALVIATDPHGEVVGSATSGDDGSYQLASLQPGTYTLATSAEGYQPTAVHATVTSGAPTRHDTTLQPAVTVRGVVRARTGSPLADARVSLLDTAGNAVAVHTTGSDGAYVFTGLPGAQYTVVAAGYPPVATPITLRGTGHDNLDIALQHTD